MTKFTTTVLVFSLSYILLCISNNHGPHFPHVLPPVSAFYLTPVAPDFRSRNDAGRTRHQKNEERSRRASERSDFSLILTDRPEAASHRSGFHLVAELYVQGNWVIVLF
jgi:hypothetical protein